MVSAGSRVATGLRPLAVMLVALSLVGGLVGGLLRAGVALPMGGAAWVGPAITQHAALLICGFLGSVIGFERAVAVRSRPALLAPLLSAHVASRGHLVLAGILARQAEQLREAYAPWQLELTVDDEQDGWILMTARRPA